MSTIASQITSLTSVYSTVYSDADQRKHQSSASLAFVWEFPAQMASNAEMFPFDDVIMKAPGYYFQPVVAAHRLTGCDTMATYFGVLVKVS